ncbi:hypothetical protein BCR44DRAFT_1285349 [Catenaria anguillulae PL171]|uniref:VWFD domain-containing protein n=1 Tax=Catenaria anguillulae PL171 TaxID=765915 RepID=A0A1Y2HWL6_9FUNG|nr:hypothetical protein BCR44DRAFT_1285349 [Catenaria anguillulae PL171]
MGTYLRGRTSGLCGTFDGNGANDFTGGNGHVYNAHQLIRESNADPANQAATFRHTGLNAFGESWRVPAADNIFAGVRTANRLPLDVAVNQCLRPAASSVKCTWADPEPCLDAWQSSWAFVQQGTRLRRAVIPGAATNSTCGSSSAVVPDPIVVAAVPPGFQAQVQIPKFDGKAPEAPKGEAKPVAPPSQEEIDVFARECSTKIGDIRGCMQDRNKFVDNCQVDINQLMHPQAAWELHRLAYTEACKEELLSLAQEPDETVAAAARELAREQSLGNAPCDANCKQCTDRGCTECKQPTLYEIKNGRCELKSGDTPVANSGAFEPLPAARILSRNEVAPQASEDQIRQVGDNPAVNPLAIVQQALGSGPIKLT